MIHKKTTVLKALYYTHGIAHENYGHIKANPLRQWLYTLKAMICVILGWKRKTHPWDSMWYQTEPDPVEGMATWDLWHSHGGLSEQPLCENWYELEVGYGVLRGWYYSIYTNSSY